MKKILFTLSMFVAAILLLVNNTSAQTNSSSSNLLRHIVIITFKHDASADSIFLPTGASMQFSLVLSVLVPIIIYKIRVSNLVISIIPLPS
jgi:hypothetical protein